MLEYFTYKKMKKHRAQKEVEDEAKCLAASNRDSDDALEERAHSRLNDPHGKRRHDGYHDDEDAQTPPVLQPDDEIFLQQLLAVEDGPAPSLPPRNYLNEFGMPSDNEGAASADESKKSLELAGETSQAKGGALKTAEKKPGRFALFFSKTKKSNEEGLKPHGVPPAEGERETKDLSRVLDRLNLSARNNKVVSTDSSELLQKFTQVFKDLVNGVPTAYDDLAKLVEDRDGTLSKGFDKLPSSLQKLVAQLPDKITGSLAPEILAAAASKQGIKADAHGGVKGVAKNILMPHNLAELVTKPGAIVGMLRAIVEVLKTRWPAFIGMNVIWSVALTLLLFMLWYCHKRGREVRLESEQSAAAIDGSDRIEELPDDPALPAPEPRVADASGRWSGRSSPTPQLSHRPAAQRRGTSGSNRH
ncbi:hypothetical protein G6O67_000390 [Ophiocordyceps sinensis]|uniref:Ring-like domain-containing protein n=2 Tax=Ophiocordyceps sinensis TaxID=72228 RepID=A0A8H4PZ44_9HYPO|nr:hypothetical protein OCS_04918 [Ophiocordyceps sinensis CO18]KAF4513068.1 hypothetical protein G6O67_000390 [Ophiocordyceps sinensis]